MFAALVETNGTVLHVHPESLTPPRTPTAIWDCAWWADPAETKRRLRKAIAHALLGKGCSCVSNVRMSGDQTVRVAAYPVERASETLIVIYGFASADDVRGQLLQDLEALLYGASHDMQEPLRIIQGYSQLVIARYGPSLDDEGRRLLGVVADATRRMSDLTQALLAFAASESPVLQPVDTARSLGDAISNLRLPIEETNAVITFDPLPAVMGHQAELTQVFQNLLSNAIKYRKPAEAPHVHVSVRHEGAFWRFTVTDGGVGFDPGQKEAVFGLFVRLHGLAQAGFGLGLTLCRRIVERMGGRIWAEAEPGVGSSFHFTLRMPE